MNVKGPIVLIDDDQDDQEIIGGTIIELMPGHTLRRFINGREAIAYLQTTSEQPFLIICDMNMPVMNGLELLENIEKDYELKSKSIPFIFLSTAADQRAVQRSYDLGVQGFFKKPESIKQLRHLLALTFEFWQNCLHPNHEIFIK